MSAEGADGEHMIWEFESSDAAAAQNRRRDFSTFLHDHGTVESDFSAAELIFGELIGNVVRHAPGPIKIRVDWPHDFPTLHVHDEGKGFVWKPVLPDDPLAEGHRGLFIIGLFARAIEVYKIPNDGSRVSVVLPVRRRGHIKAETTGELRPTWAIS